MKVDNLIQLRELLDEMGLDDAIIFHEDYFDGALIGVSHDGRAVYSYKEMVRCFAEHFEMTESEAEKFIDYDSMKSVDYIDDGPIIVYELPV